MPSINDILFHLGENRENYFNAVAPPIIQSSNFAFQTLDAFRSAIADEQNHHIYTRGNNPTVAILRQKLAALEGTEDALIFSSGSAAIASTILSQVQQGSHVVCVSSPYAWTKIMLENYLPRFGVSHTFVDGTDLGQIKAAFQENTSLLYLESPNSLTFELQDLEACASMAKEHGIVTCIDNSYSTPLYQKPHELGIDLVVHSGTKYLNGHSDVVFGVVCGSKDLLSPMFHNEYMTLGGIISPNDAALVLRGLRTLPIRMQRSHESAMVITEYLANHPKVARVIYPYHPSFPQYELAQRQMQGAGGLFSIQTTAQSIAEAEAFFHQLRRFLLAVSWGGHESLVIPTVAFYNIPGREDSPLPFNLVRFYIGLEDPEYLMEDLEQALAILP